MTGIEFDFPLQDNGASGHMIKVIGVGGGGGNAVRTMFEKGIEGVDFYIANTDAQVLNGSPIPHKIQLGAELTNGLGCGAKPEVGREAALESRQQIVDLLSGGTRMVFVTAGMGGGTGTGGAPIIAEVARELGILTVGIVTTPFTFEGKWRSTIAEAGVHELERVVDTLLVINNANLMEICPRNIKAKDAYKMADKVLCDAAKGIAEIITIEGFINVDFADVQTVMKASGTALMGMATHHGDSRAINAVEDALSSPLLDNIDISGATGVLVNITASEDTLTMDEVETVGDYIHKAVGDNARIIMGQVLTDEAGDDITVTVIATGFDKQEEAPVREAPKFEVTNRPAVEREPLQLPKSEPTPEPRVEKREEPTPPRRQEERHMPSLFDAMDKREPEAEPEEEFYHPTTELAAPAKRPARQVNPSMDPTNPKDINEMERVPSYLRREVNIEHDTSNRKKISRLTVDDEGEEGYKLRDNNSFLFDNVD